MWGTFPNVPGLLNLLKGTFRNVPHDMRTRHPRKMADVLSELLVRTGCARVQATESLKQVWHSVVKEPLAAYTRLGHVRRGVLEVYVAHSPLLQELSFRKKELLAGLMDRLPDEGIKDLRFRLAAVE